MNKEKIKFLKEVPGIDDIAGEDFVENFEKKMDKWLQKLVPVYEVAKQSGVNYFEFGDERPTKDKYVVDPRSKRDDAEFFTKGGISYMKTYARCPDCGEKLPGFLFVISNKDRSALSWRRFHCPDAENYYEEKGNILLIPYLDPRINDHPLYAGVIENIRAEFRKITGDENVSINFEGTVNSMHWNDCVRFGD